MEDNVEKDSSQERKEKSLFRLDPKKQRDLRTLSQFRVSILSRNVAGDSSRKRYVLELPS